MISDKVYVHCTKVFAVIVAFLSIPQFLRGEFLKESSFGGIMFAINQWLCFALAPFILFDFVRSRTQSPEQTSEAEDIGGRG